MHLCVRVVPSVPYTTKRDAPSMLTTFGFSQTGGLKTMSSASSGGKVPDARTHMSFEYIDNKVNGGPKPSCS